jgi:repressor LexA
MDKLTDRQKQVFDFLVTQTRSNGYPPSIREIGKALGISTLKGVTCHLEALERKGFIERTSSARGIKLKNIESLFTSETIIKLELKSTEKKKEPEYVPVPKSMVEGDENTTFLYQVKGNSMKEDAILDGDIVIVQYQPTAKNGEVIVAEVGGKTIINKYFREKGRVRLQPTNSELQAVYMNEDFVINGKVIGLLRTPRKAAA